MSYTQSQTCTLIILLINNDDNSTANRLTVLCPGQPCELAAETTHSLASSLLLVNFLHLLLLSWQVQVVSYWRGYVSGARCKWFAYGPADATATPSSLASLNPAWFNFLVPAYPGCPRKRPLNVCSSWQVRQAFPVPQLLSLWRQPEKNQLDHVSYTANAWLLWKPVPHP